MKNKTTVIAVCLGVAGMAFGQGSLTPPGAPVPTMKTLDQVEPRIPVFSSPIILNEPGSYYLTQNLSGTVTIAANNISLDLMGFSINAASGNALRFSGARKNLRIHNGVLSAPAGNGMDFSTSYADANGLVENLRISDCLNSGVVVDSGFTIRNVLVQRAGIAAISVNGNSRILDCSATASGTGLKATGTGALIENNRVWGNTDNYDLATGNQLNILLCEVPETLDWPCSVKLAGTLTCTQAGDNGITVAADDVAIDLDGHALIGSGALSGHGIFQDSLYHNLTVKNGKVVRWQGAYMDGIHAYDSANLSCIQVSSNGYCGIHAGNGSTVSGCAAYGNGDTGIDVFNGTVSDCTAYGNGGNGIEASASMISDCAANTNGGNGIMAYVSTVSGCSANNNVNDGICVGTGGTVSGCMAYRNGNTGIYANFRTTISGCTANRNTSNGIRVDYDSLVANCVCANNGDNGNGTGICATDFGNRIDSNTVTGNDCGIAVYKSGNFIVRNTANGNNTDYDIAAGNDTGTIQTSPVGAGAWDNFEF